jgi:multidrug efflux pump subunit AcrA (membrane-fusion protein)
VDSDVKAAEKADTANKNHVAVPFAGVVTPSVAEGDTVEAGQAVASIEAMKMEAAITDHRVGHREAPRDRPDQAGRGRRPGLRDRLSPAPSRRRASR